MLSGEWRIEATIRQLLLPAPIRTILADAAFEQKSDKRAGSAESARPMLIEATSDLATRITGAIRDAAGATGASSDYLPKSTVRESNLNPGAKAPASLATACSGSSTRPGLRR
jgi:hypothetical protein